MEDFDNLTWAASITLAGCYKLYQEGMLNDEKEIHSGWNPDESSL